MPRNTPPNENFVTSRGNKNYVATQQMLRRDVSKSTTAGEEEKIVANFATWSYAWHKLCLGFPLHNKPYTFINSINA